MNHRLDNIRSTPERCTSPLVGPRAGEGAAASPASSQFEDTSQQQSKARWAVPLAFILVLIVILAVSVAKTIVANSGVVPSSWVGVQQGDSGAVLIQWTDNNGSLSGVMSQTQFGPVGTAPRPHSVDFTGTLSNGDLIIHFRQFFDFGQTVSGTATDSQLTLDFTNSDGLIGQSTLGPGSTDDYNNQLRRLTATWSGNAGHQQFPNG